MISIVKGPYLQWPTRSSMTIMWETSTDSIGQVNIFETQQLHADGHGRFRTIETSRRTVDELGSDRRVHTVNVPDLLPETVYHYQVVSVAEDGSQCESELFVLKTAVEQSTPFSFTVTSETGGAYPEAVPAAIFAQMQMYRPDFLLMVGDAVFHGRQYDDWARDFLDPGRTLLYDTPFYLCLGNHEENSPWYYQFVAYPEPKNYYAFHYGNAHFIALDSTAMIDITELARADKVGDAQKHTVFFGPGNAQHDFLINELENSDAIWKVVFFHYPPYVSGDHQVAAMRELCPILEQFDVDLVFNSHTIVYERSHPLRAGKVDYVRGVRYLVVGGAGCKPEWFHSKRAWHTAQSRAVPHFVQVVVADGHLELQAVTYEGHVFDWLVLDKV